MERNLFIEVMESEIKTYRQFYNPVEANIIRTKLIDQGIECFLTNENSTNNLWHLSIAHGGINLMMKIEDFAKADQILKYPEDLNIDTEYENNIHCPACGSSNVSFGPSTKRRLNFIGIFISIITFTPAPFAHNTYHCFNCDLEFDYADCK